MVYIYTVYIIYMEASWTRDSAGIPPVLIQPSCSDFPWNKPSSELAHRIHGAAIYGNIYHQYTVSPMLPYIAYMDPMGWGTPISGNSRSTSRDFSERKSSCTPLASSLPLLRAATRRPSRLRKRKTEENTMNFHLNFHHPWLFMSQFMICFDRVRITKWI